jgi:hypothetical protein
MRAFTLTWALDNDKLIYEKEIAIVGGGLAGVTAAIVCLLRGACNVTLYDKAHELMALQRGAVHRYVHPMIFRWPDCEEADTKPTEFGILNWRSGTADAISKKVLTQANNLLDRCLKQRGENRATTNSYTQRLGCDVRQIIPTQDGKKVLVLAEGRNAQWVVGRNEFLPVGGFRSYYDRYDVVIAAVGYGLESELACAPFRSYWNLDTLSQATIREPWPRRWLVSGTGDGGLIDAIRLRLSDASQKELAELLTGKCRHSKILKEVKQTKDGYRKEVRSLSKALGRVEAKMRKMYQTFLRKRTLKMEKRKRETDTIGKNIQQEFHALSEQKKHEVVFNVLKTFFRTRERTDTFVYLNGPQTTPYEMTASLFNRFLIYLLRRYCGLRYRAGKARLITQSPSSGIYRFVFDQEEKGSERIPGDYLEVDDVVIRHGAKSAFGALFGTGALNKMKKKNKATETFEASLWAINNIRKNWLNSLHEPKCPKSRCDNHSVDSKLEAVQQSIKNLLPNEVAAFRQWYCKQELEVNPKVRSSRSSSGKGQGLRQQNRKLSR